jgi:hypothetical protein
MSPSAAALILAWACILLLALATAGLLRRVDALERQIPDGAAPAAADGPRPGLQVPLSRYLAGAVTGDRDVLLLIVSPSCGSCRTALAALAAATSTDVDVVVATAAESLAPLELPSGFVGVPRAGDLVDVLGVPGTPYLLRLGPDGTVRRADVVTSATDVAGWTVPRAASTVLAD